MKPVHVIFPVLRGSRRFFVEKGRRWSVIEHLLLDSVAREPATAVELHQQSGLPRRVIVEAFIRLMRAGWAEINTTPTGPVFQATPLGATKVTSDQLPAATVIEPRWRSFAVEQITGGVFRGRELDIRPQSRLPFTTDEQTVVHLQGSSLHATGELSEVFTAIEGEDELIVGVDRSAEKLLERYAVVTVRDEIVDGLPSRANPALRDLIIGRAKEAVEAASESKKSPEGIPAEAVPTPSERVEPLEEHQSKPALYDSDDLIVDGPAHLTALERTIRNASERLIIHSTFITEQRASALLPTLLHAAGKGVTIDILWGQDDVGGTTSSSKEAALKLQNAISSAGRDDLITIHPFSTNSHAKIVVADNGRGGWHALIGSCNWLASDFQSFETSMRLRDPLLVGLLIRRLAGLSRGRPGLWDELSIEMTVLGRRVENIPRGNGRTVPMRLLFAPDHSKLLLEARDRAKKRIFILSHRIGISARPMALLPTLAAVKANNIEASLYYGRTTGPLSGTAGADLIREFAKQGLAVRPVHQPRIHAKVLGWDDDALAVSSLNWLSADPSDAALYREIGILVEAPRIADNFIRLFQNARID
jgi:phosphatidylserine/phosphatidylglycerophosphate/cardiolipin synthase-like enzyme